MANKYERLNNSRDKHPSPSKTRKHFDRLRAKAGKPRVWYETQDFRELQKEWDQKLKDDGFSDIEYRHNSNGESDFLDGVNTMYFVRKGRYRCDGDADYYATARRYRWILRQAPRAPIDDIRVWDLHTAGVSTANICRTLELGRRIVTKLLNKHRDEIRRRAREGDPI